MIKWLVHSGLSDGYMGFVYSYTELSVISDERSGSDQGASRLHGA
jgi:hypothetical protein